MLGQIWETVLFSSYLRRNSIILIMARVRAQHPMRTHQGKKTPAQLYHAYDDVTAKLTISSFG